MSKFKVGDKVRGNSADKYALTSDRMTLGGIVRVIKNPGIDDIVVKIINQMDGKYIGHKFQVESKYFDLVEPAEPRREFIVIHRDGNVMTAEHRVNRDVIKSAKATCAPSDTFDFDTGAKLAFDRLMGREEQSSLSPADIFFAFTGRPAPEPPKFYTGKVVMVDCEFPDRKHLINHLFEFKNGRQVGNKMHGMSFNHAPYTSFEQIVSTHNASTWIEVKSDV